MSDRAKSAAGRILSELYRDDQRRREEPGDEREGSRADPRDAGDDRRPERAA